MVSLTDFNPFYIALYRCKHLHMRRFDGTPLGRTEFARVEQACFGPWWLVHRADLHAALVQRARELGAQILTGKRVARIDTGAGKGTEGGKAKVLTDGGEEWEFDLVVGADGLHSVARRTLYPDVRPAPPTTNAAFRAVVPMSEVAADPVAGELAKEKNMEVWMGEGRYIISYPISGGKGFNMVLSHHAPEKVWAVEQEVQLEELRGRYADFDERIRRVVGMVKSVVRILSLELMLVIMALRAHDR